MALSGFLRRRQRKKEEAYHQQPRATHSEYVPPVAVPVAAAIPAPAPVPPPMVQPLAPSLLQPRAIAEGQATKKEDPRPAVYSYASTAMPEYMKPKAIAASTGGADTAGGISFKPASFDGTKSFTIPHRDYLLMRWSTMICVMDTEIITGASGSAPFRCHLKNDVLSPTGVTLLEAGTIVGGTYTSLVGEGQSRIVAVTAEAQSPNGVIADIGGPIADQLGAAGVEGSVDNHWMARIGGALLLTLVDSGLQVLESEIQKNAQNTNISIGGGGGGGGLTQLGNQLLAKTINIPPTITLNQGTEVALWVTKFIDFSGLLSPGGKMNKTLHHLLKPFEPFQHTPTVTEIVVNRCGQFGVEDSGKWSFYDEPFLTYDRLEAIAILAAYATSQDFGPDTPLCAASLPGGERMQACCHPATTPGTISLTIRKPSEKLMSLDDVDFPALFTETNTGHTRRSRSNAELARLHRDQDWRGFFKLAMRERKTIGVCGSVGSGKTTFLKRLLREVPDTDRIVTIEDTAEIGDVGPSNRVNLFYGDGRAKLTAEDVLKASLRMRPDRLIFQEIRAGEAFAFLRGLATGHSGATSWHAEEGREWDALALMVRQHQAGRAIPDGDMQRYLEQFIDIIVWVSRDDTGFKAPRVWLKGQDNAPGETSYG